MTLLLSRDLGCAWVFVPAVMCYLICLVQHFNDIPRVGFVEVFHSDSLHLISPAYQVEVVSTGYSGLAGIAWIDDEARASSYVLAADAASGGADICNLMQRKLTHTNKERYNVSGNIWMWEEGKGLLTVGKSIYRRMPEDAAPAALMRVSTVEGVELLVCEYGSKSVSRIYANTSSRVLTADFMGSPYSGPKAVVVARDQRALYFTDPAQASDPSPHGSAISNVYMLPLEPSGEAAGPPVLIDSSLRSPYGISFSSDEKILYVSDADPGHAVVRAFIVSPDGMLHDAGTFFDAEKWYRDRNSSSTGPTVLRGLTTDAAGRVYVASQDGVLILPPDGGSPLAYIHTGRQVSHIALSKDGFMYMSARTAVLRVPISLGEEW